MNTGEALVSLDARPDSGEGHHRRRRREHGLAAAVRRAGERHPRRRADAARDQARDRLRRRRPGRREGQERADPRLGGAARPARASASTCASTAARRSSAALRELDALVEALARVKAERTPQLRDARRRARIGKSRLVWELFGAIERGDDARLLAPGPLAPVRRRRELLGARRDGQGPGRHPRERRRRRRPARSSTERSATRSARTTPTGSRAHLRPLVGIGRRGVAAGGRDEAFAAWRRFFEALAEQRPLVLVFEDLHWADDGLLDFIDDLSTGRRDVPLLVVCTARPELLERRPGWGGGKLNATTHRAVAARGRRRGAAVALSSSAPVLPAETQQTLLERAERQPALRRAVRAPLRRARLGRRRSRCRRRCTA